MGKKRGLKKHFRKLGEYSILERLDFSGSKNSWFDLFHIHIDNSGLGNRSWKSRKQYLDALFILAHKLEEKLYDFPKEFQFWVEISGNDSFEDAIYIHTSNPNEQNFPISIDYSNQGICKNTKLLEYLSKKDFDIQTAIVVNAYDKEEINFFLTKRDFGLRLN